MLEFTPDAEKCRVAVDAADALWFFLEKHRARLNTCGTVSLFDNLDLHLSPVINRHRNNPNAPHSAAQLAGTLLYDGIDTFKTLLGNTLFAMLRDRSQYEQLASDNNLAAAAWTEGLRHSASAWATYRAPTVDLEISGVPIAANTPVMMIWAAANHDPRLFAEPARFDLTRKGNRPLTFGGGSRTCLGAPMSTQIGELALRKLAQAFPQMELQGEQGNWSAFNTVRWIDAVRVSTTPT